jgi:hypothetical protein
MTLNILYHKADFRDYLNVLLSVMLNVVILIVVMLIVVMLIVVMLIMMAPPGHLLSFRVYYSTVVNYNRKLLMTMTTTGKRQTFSRRTQSCLFA